MAASVRVQHLPRLPRVSSFRMGLAAAAFAAVLIGGTALLLFEASLVASAGYNNARLTEQKRSLEHRTQELEADVSSLRSLDRVDAEARSKLGMVTATSYLYIQVDPNLKDRARRGPEPRP